VFVKEEVLRAYECYVAETQESGNFPGRNLDEISFPATTSGASPESVNTF